jgi:hypothetical protein
MVYAMIRAISERPNVTALSGVNVGVTAVSWCHKLSDFRLSHIHRVRQQDTTLLFFIVKVRQKIQTSGNVENQSSIPWENPAL